MNCKGFTLLEILIAITIFALILAVLYPSYTGTFTNIEAAESQSAIYHMARIALERITDDLQSAYLVTKKEGENEEDEADQTPGFLGQDLTIEARDADSLQFTSEEHLIFAEDDRKGRGRIAYSVKETEAYLYIYRSDTLELENQKEEEEGFILCDRLHSLNITYKDENGETYDYWDSSDEQFKNKLPTLISLQLSFINEFDPESPIRFITSVSLPLAWNKYGKSP